MLEKSENLLFEDLFKNDLLRTINHIPRKKVNCKVIRCGKIIQIYLFSNSYYVNDKGYENNIEDNLIGKEKFKKEYKLNLKEIEYRNLIRSKNKMIRIVNTNLDKFKSFITLTFADNITDLSYANKEYDKFITKIKRKYKDFLSIAVPEFQKNGSIHYHLLTNIDYYENDLINENLITNKLYQNKNESQIKEFIKNNMEEELLKKYNKKELNSLNYCFRLQNGKYENTKCSFSKKSEEYKIFKTIRYWKNGYSSVIPLENINIVGYMTKYMIKDYDNRLFGRHRYLCYGNLKKPVEEYFNLEKIEDLQNFIEICNEFSITMQNNYYDKFGNIIEFIELKEI